MIHRLWRWALTALILASFSMTGPASAASKPKVVVLAVPGKIPNLKGPVYKHIAFGMAKDAEIIGFKKYSKAATALKVKKKAMFFPKGAKKVAASLGATHVVFI